ncbi:MAG: class I SAM-dependent methyltransferase [Rhodothermaceae bacterium]
MKDYKNYSEKQNLIHGSVHMNNKKAGRGPTSFHMHNQSFVFREFDIKPGNVFLDLGCGAGEYAVQARNYVGEDGFVYALDVMEETIDALNKNAKEVGVKNIKAIKSDITKPLPLESDSIDICLISTVLHTLSLEATGDDLFKEIFRVLKPEGRMITIDCKKEENGFGPPLHLRISPDELEKIVLNQRFKKLKLTDLGHFYMYQFSVEK